VTFEGGGGSEIVRQLIESGQEVVELARSEAAEQSRHIRIERLARLLITIDLSMAEAARSIG
jgi:short-subunit dehydrogenase